MDMQSANRALLESAVDLEEALGLTPADQAAPEQTPLITAAMLDVRRVVTRIAFHNEPMPNNPVLGELIGRGRSSARRALFRLQRVGKAKLEFRGSERRCWIAGIDAWTAWGEARPGHSPYIYRKWGEPPADPKPKVRAPETRPMAFGTFSLSPDLPDVDDAYRSAPTFTAPAPGCQYPLWDDGTRAGSQTRYCGETSAEASSFCAEHHALCYPRSKPRTRVLPASTPVLSRLVDGADVSGDRVYSTEALFNL